MFKIENNIPQPEPHLGTKAKYPFTTMEVGQSVFIDGGKHDSNPAIAAKMYAKRSGKKFTIRKIDNGVRVWRVA